MALLPTRWGREVLFRSLYRPSQPIEFIPLLGELCRYLHEKRFIKHLM
jgi:hypothetical protein